ncbi:MAG TPA: hypothetical protein DDW42_05975 [Desulfobacteraceae bacterium]|nr:hypothetical protein [Desulfobacteraceae bacterium]
MQFKKIKEQEPKLGIAPLIDVVFLLLIFFMLTSHFDVGSGIAIKLPKVAQKAYERERQKIVLLIDRSGHIYLKSQVVDLKKLGKKLQSFVEKDGLNYLLLEADKDTKHGRVVQVMDVAKKAGISSIIIAAQWEPEKVF